MRARAWRIENSPARGPRHENSFRGWTGKSVLVSREGKEAETAAVPGDNSTVEKFDRGGYVI